MKTKLFKQLLVALSLLLAAPSMAQFAYVHLSSTPGMANAYVSAYNQTEGYDITDSIIPIKIIGQQPVQIMLKAGAEENWAFVNWTDGNGTEISTYPYEMIQISAAGDYYFTANYRYSPRNPGYLPMGSYDLETATLTVYNPQGGNMMENYYALSDRYNLPSHAKEHQHMDQAQNTNPVETVILQGFVEDTWYVNELLMSTNAKALDLAQMNFYNNEVPGYLVAYTDSIQTIMLGGNIASIAENAFINLNNMRDVYCYTQEVPQISSNSFVFNNPYDTTSEAAVVTLHVPGAMLTAYQSDTTWAGIFPNIVAEAISSTANVAVYPQMIMDDMYLKINQVGGTDTMSVQLYSSQTRYDLVNLEKGTSYHVAMFSPLGFMMDEQTFALNADTAISLTNAAPLGTIPARVFVDTAEVTGQCLITWFNTAADQVLGTGSLSPMLPMQYNTKVNVTPLGELATYILPMDTFTVNSLGHNGLWLQLERKPVGGQDTVRVETGSIVVTIAGEVDNIVGLLYDSEGTLLGKSLLEQMNLGGVFAMQGLPVGCYTIVLMREGQYSTLSRLDLYTQMGLTEGTDYLAEDFCIVADQVTNVALQTIPAEPQITNFLGTNARFYANKTEVMVAGQIVLTAEVDFLEEYLGDISNLFYVIDLPDNVLLVENSVMVGNNAVSYTLQNNQLRVGAGLVNLANVNASALRFCVTPIAEGDYYPSAAVEFNYLSQPKTQPLSNTFFTAKAITIQAPHYIVDKRVNVTGFAPAGAAVTIKTAENEAIGQGTANALGKYNIHCAFTANESRLMVLHAEASTNIISGLMSDTCSVFYDAEFACPTEIQMTHYNRWYKRNMNIVWNLENCTTNESYYYYYLSADFTFRTTIVGQVDSVEFVVIGQDGSRTIIKAQNSGNQQWVATKYTETYKIPIRVDLVYYVGAKAVPYETCKSVSAIADPSGYVYEAVSSNRLEGVTAAAYMKRSENDVPVLWDAEPYDQKNPLLTDEAGGYAWDVPMALWQVRFSKEGYEPTQTKWLPVPPPQMEVNMPLVRMSAPEVQNISAYQDYLTIDFDRYMMPEDLTTAMIVVTDGSSVIPGEIHLLNNEARFKGDSVYFASQVKFTPNANFIQSPLTINFGAVRSYAGVPMAPHSENVNVVAEVKNFGGVDTIKLTVGENYQRMFYALPQMASEGKTMILENAGDFFTVSATSATIAANGGALFTFTGKMPGTTELHLIVEGTNLETYVPVVVAPAPVGPITNIEEVKPVEVKSDKAEKFIRNSMFYIRHNGKCFTATGVQVE